MVELKFYFYIYKKIFLDFQIIFFIFNNLIKLKLFYLKFNIVLYGRKIYIL